MVVNVNFGGGNGGGSQKSFISTKGYDKEKMMLLFMFIAALGLSKNISLINNQSAHKTYSCEYLSLTSLMYTLSPGFIFAFNAMESFRHKYIIGGGGGGTHLAETSVFFTRLQLLL